MAELLEYKCPCCGGAIRFDSASQKMKCPYCDTMFEMETLKAYDEELKQEPKDNLNWETYDETSGNGDWQEGEREHIVTFLCESCGGQIVGDENMAATSCPYCGNPVVVVRQFSGMLRPDYIIPFQLDKEAAKKALQNHLKGKRLLPKFFKDENHIEKITGIYVPFWLFDCDADASIRYRATRTRVWSDNDYTYTKTNFYHVIRAGDLSFTKVPVDGSSKMDDTYMESVEPFDYTQAVDFQTAYLAGYVADKYDVDAKSSVLRANERIKNSTVAAFAATTIGYDSCVPESTNVQIRQGEIHYALLPVWMLNTKYKGKTYQFAMNGQTGKFIGELPVDRGLYWKYFFGIFAGVAAAASVVMFLI